MDPAKKKACKDAYKARTVIGGICLILCSGNDRFRLQATRDINSLKNRFDFAVKMNSCPEPTLRSEWDRYGTDSFSFSVLEELKKKEDQTDREFVNDLNLLHELWADKLGSPYGKEGAL